MKTNLSSTSSQHSSTVLKVIKNTVVILMWIKGDQPRFLFLEGDLQGRSACQKRHREVLSL